MKLITSLLLFSSLVILKSQSLEYDFTITGGSNISDSAYGVELDQNGNIYCLGTYYDQLIVNNETLLNTNGNKDIFILKYNPNGVLIWAKSIAGVNNERTKNNLKIDNLGNVYLAGLFNGSILSDEFELTSDGLDGFVIKFDNNGNIIWSKLISLSDDSGNPYLDAADIYGLDLDSNNNVFIGGYFSGSLSVGESIIESQGINDCFFMKLSSDGTLDYLNNIGSSSIERCYGIHIDNEDNLLLTGFYSSGFDFDYSSSVDYIEFLGNNTDVFVTKISNSGDYLWTKAFEGDGANAGYYLTTDNSNNIYLSGNYYDADIHISPTLVLENLGDNDCFLLKLDNLGNVIFGKSIGGSGNDTASAIVTKDNELYFSSVFSNSINVLENNIQSAGNFDVLILKLDLDGNIENYYNFGNTSKDIVYDMDYLNNNLILVGSFENSLNFNFISDNSDIKTSNGSSDFFITKLTENNLGTSEINSINSIVMYPTIINDKLFFDFKNEIIEGTTIKIYDTNGKLIEQMSLKNDTSSINLTDLQKGFYFIQLLLDNKVILTKKIIKNNYH